jgi:hypothetical protein
MKYTGTDCGCRRTILPLVGLTVQGCSKTRSLGPIVDRNLFRGKELRPLADQVPRLLQGSVLRPRMTVFSVDPWIEEVLYNGIYIKTDWE